MLSLRAGRQVFGACKLVNKPLIRCSLHTSKPTSTFAKDLFLGRFNKVHVSYDITLFDRDFLKLLFLSCVVDLTYVTNTFYEDKAKIVKF